MLCSNVIFNLYVILRFLHSTQSILLTYKRLRGTRVGLLIYMYTYVCIALIPVYYDSILLTVRLL